MSAAYGGPLRRGQGDWTGSLTGHRVDGRSGSRGSIRNIHLQHCPQGPEAASLLGKGPGLRRWTVRSEEDSVEKLPVKPQHVH